MLKRTHDYYYQVTGQLSLTGAQFSDFVVSPYDVLPNSVGIIDGTEVYIQCPSNLETQKSSFSDYRSHTTVKYLVAIYTFSVSRQMSTSIFCRLYVLQTRPPA